MDGTADTTEGREVVMVRQRLTAAKRPYLSAAFRITDAGSALIVNDA
jgi:hypothetical protein